MIKMTITQEIIIDLAAGPDAEEEVVDKILAIATANPFAVKTNVQRVPE